MLFFRSLQVERLETFFPHWELKIGNGAIVTSVCLRQSAPYVVMALVNDIVQATGSIFHVCFWRNFMHEEIHVSFPNIMPEQKLLLDHCFDFEHTKCHHFNFCCQLVSTSKKDRRSNQPFYPLGKGEFLSFDFPFLLQLWYFGFSFACQMPFFEHRSRPRGKLK